MEYKTQENPEQNQAIQYLSKDYKRPVILASQRPINRISQNTCDLNKSGHWSQKQNAKYYAFLEKFRQKFCQKQSRRQWKVFKALSKFIKTRNANQCRSHHHKMSKNFNSIQQTLEFLSTKHPILKTKSLKYAQQLQNIDIGAQQITFPDTFGKLTSQDKIEIKQPQIKNTSQVYENQHQKDVLKQNQIGFMRTQATYNYQQQPFDQEAQNMNQGLINPYRQFPTTGLMSSVGTNYVQEPTYYFNNSYEYGYGNMLQQMEVYNRQKLREQRWMQCHELFIAWMSKVQSLMYE